MKKVIILVVFGLFTSNIVSAQQPEIKKETTKQVKTVQKAKTFYAQEDSVTDNQKKDVNTKKKKLKHYHKRNYINGLYR